MSFATDDEIRIAHEILLKGDKPFDNSRIDIIKNDSSCYVQASPGSGKTTTLLAKLIILANRMPLPDGKGICVLTHTNVAIDEIKAKLGQKADVLFRYPNFFGTIQTFLHKYVTAAALKFFYGGQIDYVDDDIANGLLVKKFNRLPVGKSKLRGYVYNQIAHKKHFIDLAEINLWGGVDLLLAANVIKKEGKKYSFQLENYDLTHIPWNIRSLINAKKRSILDSEEQGIIYSSKINWIDNKVIINKRPINIISGSSQEYVEIKEELYKEGILSFEEAYDLAFRYIKKLDLDFSRFSNHRFKYLFIDEVQDCDRKQIELINSLFADDRVVVQRFGDYCQAIFEDEDNEIENTKLKDGPILYIHDSNRFGENIAKPLRTLCMENNQLLVGNDDVPSPKPIIITYENPLSVLPKYAELLHTTTIPEKGNRSVLEIANEEKYNDPLKRVNIKACGWVGKVVNNNHSRYIESYFPTFKRKNVRTKVEGVSFDDFILKNLQGSVKDYAASVIQGILKFIDLCDVKNGKRRHTRTSLLEFLIAKRVKEEFLNKVMSWAMSIAQSDNSEEVKNIKNHIYKYIKNTILPLFDKGITVEAQHFFDYTTDNNQIVENFERDNVYHKDGADIEITTVHAVKGETHISTLYLETSYFGKHESEYASEQFKGIPYSGKDERVLRCLKVIYVGASRPRYLLCVAIQKDRFDNIDCRELREIWNVINA